jgi:asparagine synthetase B (glutamine-hydrolysing)
MSTLDMLRRQLADQVIPRQPSYEKRYPYLDRDLLEFLYAIPREQLVRPGQRRSLMRRALVGIVPDELLHRKRKAYVSRLPTVAFTAHSAALLELSREMLSDSLGFVVQSEVTRAIDRVCNGSEPAVVPLMKALSFEQWLRCIQRHGVLRDRIGDMPSHRRAQLPSVTGATQERILG